MSTDVVTTSNAVIWSFTSIAIILVTLRLISRLHLSRAAGIDDTFIVMSLMIFIAASATYSYSASRGIGNHVIDLTPEQRVQAAKAGVISNSISVHTASWPKLAVVALLCRLFNPHKTVFVLLYTVVATLILFSCLLTIFNFAQCRPAAGFWNPSVKAACWPPTVFEGFGIFTGLYSALLDLAFAVYPVSVIWKLQIKLVKKVTLSIVMGLGLLACIAATIKSVQLFRLRSHNDLTYDFAIIDIWQAAETTVIFVAACVPTLGPLWSAIKKANFKISYAIFQTARKSYLNFDSHDQRHWHGHQNPVPDEEDVDLVGWAGRRRAGPNAGHAETGVGC